MIPEKPVVQRVFGVGGIILAILILTGTALILVQPAGADAGGNQTIPQALTPAPAGVPVNGTTPPGNNGIGPTPSPEDQFARSHPSGAVNESSPSATPPSNGEGGVSSSPLSGRLPEDLFPGGGPPNPLIGILIQFWWLIPIALVVSAACGIWYERSRKGKKDQPEERISPGLRNATVVAPHPKAAQEGQGGHEYVIRMPPALERKYPGAEYIAEGGVSRVFRVHDAKNNREAAVKIPIRFDEVTGTQFTKELTVWEGLHHKNIVELYVANIFPLPFIEMEYVESSLADQQFPIDQDRAIRILYGIAQGLRYAHERGIVHRDIKPGNILIAPDGTPKITDWGLSKEQGKKQSGIIGFSLEYAAPEQLAPSVYGEPGPWTDIYQLGVLFYEMLTGKVPFSGEGMGEITHAILHAEPQPLPSRGKNDDRISAIITKCLNKRPKDRYTSISDLLTDLSCLM